MSTTLSPSMGPVLFNSNDLESLVTGLAITSIDSYLPPKKTLGSQILAYMNKNKITSSFYTNKTITLTGVITRNTRALMEAALDSLWPLLAGIEQDLIIVESGAQRRYTATWSDFIKQESAGGYLKFSLVFTASDAYGYDPTYTQLINQSGLVAQPQTFVMGDVQGSAEWQAPIFVLFFSVLTGGSGGTLTLGNPANGQTISITRNFVAGDYVEIDSQNRTVKVNGALVDFTGALPEWNPRPIAATGQSKVTVTDTFTTRTYSLNGKYYKRYA